MMLGTGVFVIVGLGRQDVGTGLDRLIDAVLAVGVVIVQATLIPAHPLGNSLCRLIRGLINVGVLFARLHENAATDMNLQIARIAMRLARNDGVGFDAITEILADQRRERALDMRSKRIANIHLLARDA